MRHSAITRTQVALHVVSLITHRNQGHATSVMTHALQQLRDRAEYDMQAVGLEVREKVTIASSQIVAQGKMNGYVVRLLRRCCSNVGGLQVRFDPEGRRKAKDYFFYFVKHRCESAGKGPSDATPKVDDKFYIICIKLAVSCENEAHVAAVATGRKQCRCDSFDASQRLCGHLERVHRLEQGRHETGCRQDHHRVLRGGQVSQGDRTQALSLIHI